MPEKVVFQDFTFQFEPPALFRGRNRIALEPRALEVLRCLIEHPGEIVRRADIVEDVWDLNAEIQEGSNLDTHIKNIRRALGDTTRSLIETIPRVGYRLRCVVRELPNASNSKASTTATLPVGTKSLREIDDYKDPADRIGHLAKLLEFLLKSLDPEESESSSFEELLELHREKLSNHSEVNRARWVRNQIVHATGRATAERVIESERALRDSILQVLPYSSIEVETAIRGAGESTDGPVDRKRD